MKIQRKSLTRHPHCDIALLGNISHYYVNNKIIPNTTIKLIKNRLLSRFIKMGKVATTEAYRFMTDCLKAVGAAARAAEQQAELLIQADRMGHPSHGLNRLGKMMMLFSIIYTPSQSVGSLPEGSGTGDRLSCLYRLTGWGTQVTGSIDLVRLSHTQS